MNTVPTPQDYAQSHRGQFANTRQNPNSFPFTPLTKCWTSSLVHEIALHIFRRVVFSTVNVITTSIFYKHTKGNLIQRKQLHYLDNPSFLFSRSTDTFCSDCSCHKTVSLLAITLLSLSLMDADTVAAEGPELGMNSNALSRERRGLAGYLCILINLQAISRISISVLSYDVDVGSGQERQTWGRREICCLIPSRQSWRSPYKLNESSWRDQKQSEPENSNKKSYELSSKKKKNHQICSLRKRNHLKYRTISALSHTCINLTLSPLWQLDCGTTPEELPSVYKEMTQESQVQLESSTSSVITSSTACVPLHRNVWIQPSYQNGSPTRADFSCTEPFHARCKSKKTQNIQSFSIWVFPLLYLKEPVRPQVRKERIVHVCTEQKEGKGQVNQNSWNPKQAEMQILQKIPFFLFSFFLSFLTKFWIPKRFTVLQLETQHSSPRPDWYYDS